MDIRDASPTDRDAMAAVSAAAGVSYPPGGSWGWPEADSGLMVGLPQADAGRGIISDMSEDKHAERLARIKKIVAETDSRFEVVEPSPGVIQVRDNGAIFEGFTLRDYETGDYEVAVRKLVRALAEGMYPGSMFMEMMEQNRLTL